MPSNALKNSGSLNGSPCGTPFTVTCVPVPGSQSTTNCSPAMSFLCSEKIWLMRSTPGISLEKAALSMLSSIPRENSLPSSVESMSRSMVTLMRLGPRSA